MGDLVVHVKKEPFDAWVARGSKWGSPFRLGGAHLRIGAPMGRAEAIEVHIGWIARGEGRWLLKHLGELEGKPLGCFCSPEGGVTTQDPLVCHGQVLLMLLAWRREKLPEKGRGS